MATIPRFPSTISVFRLELTTIENIHFLQNLTQSTIPIIQNVGNKKEKINKRKNRKNNNRLKKIIFKNTSF